jgi:GcrA cell cycle regulator
MNMSWTDERVELLKKMWGEGQSASQIAKELGGVTRNAVIGKVHRLGLSNRAGSGAPVAATAKPAGTAAPSGASGAGAPVGMGSGSGNGAAAAAPSASETPVAEDPAPAKPRPEARPAAAEAAVVAENDDETDEDGFPISAARRAIIPAGQPLPPQPSLNEISPEALAKVSEVEKTARKLTLMELTEKTCKWPVGDPATDNFWFCGLPVQQGKPYCEAHVGVAFQPMSSRRDRRR